MVTKSDLIHLATTRNGYQMIEAKVTKQKGQIENNIKNARKHGIVHPNKKIGEKLSNFIDSVKYHYINTVSKNGYSQVYVVYSYYLYIFSPNKAKLITVYEIPESCRAEAKALIDLRKQHIPKNKISIYDRPLTKGTPKKKKKKKKQNTISIS